jgi:hypothetical protein
VRDDKMVEKGQMDVFTDYLLTVITVPLKIKPGDHTGKFQSLTTCFNRQVV